LPNEPGRLLMKNIRSPSPVSPGVPSKLNSAPMPGTSSGSPQGSSTLGRRAIQILP
jgi:hypothetical protein